MRFVTECFINNIIRGMYRRMNVKFRTRSESNYGFVCILAAPYNNINIIRHLLLPTITIVPSITHIAVCIISLVKF